MIPCVDLQCPLMYAVVVISVHAKRCRFADGKCFGYRAKFPCTNYNGGSHMFAVDKFGFMMQCKSACHQLDVVNCNSILGHQTMNLILSLRDSVGPLCV